MESVLLVDDEPDVLASQRSLLELSGYSQVIEARNGDDMRAALASNGVDLILLDLTLPGESGEELLSFLSAHHPAIPVIVVTGASEITTAVRCMQAGAYDYLIKGRDSGRIPSSIRNALHQYNTNRENALLRAALTRPILDHPAAFSDFVSRSESVRRLLVYLEALASLNDPILLEGETGVGKELVARGIHRSSGATGAFVAVNLGGLDDQMVSDTLFGHKKGAFTGANGNRAGLLREASEGTLFLDEIGEMSLVSQARLLRLLDNGEFLPLGSDRIEYARARFVFATNRNLDVEVENGSFRRDLYYRISTHRVRIPPLRERPDDIAPILDHLVSVETRRTGRAAPRLTSEDGAAIERLTLRGNVRELRQVVLRAILEGNWKTALPPVVDPAPPHDGEPARSRSDDGVHDQAAHDGGVRFGDTLPTPEEVVVELLREAERRHPGRRSDAAASIGLSPQAYANRWKRLHEGHVDR